MVKIDLENPFLARPKSVKIGRSYWQAQSKAPTILKQKNTWVKQRNDRNYKAFRNYLQTEGARVLNREVKEYLTTSNDNTWTAANRNPKNPHLQARATKGAKSHALWEKEHPVLNAVGTIAGAAPLAVAAAPLGVVASDIAGPTVASMLTNPYVNTALTSAGIADAGTNYINGNIKTPYDGAMAALEISPIAGAGFKTGYKLANNAINNFKNNLEGATTWGGKFLNDVINYPKFTANAMRNGRYIYNKKSLIKHARRAMNSINKGYSFVDDAYSQMVGFTPSEPRTKLGYSEKTPSSSFFSPTTNKIKIGLNYRNSNVPYHPNTVTINAGHERVHSHNEALNRIYHTPNLGVWDESTGYYVPNPNHPIAKKYMDYFRRGPVHGRYPEETFANALGFKAAYPNVKVSPAVEYSNAEEHMNIPPEFIHDYIEYIKNTYNN